MFSYCCPSRRARTHVWLPLVALTVAAVVAAAPAAAADTLFHVGRPILITSVTVALGFGMFALAPFRPTMFFGLLIALTALTALLCDFVILPALLQIRAAIPAPDLGASALGPTPSSRR